RLFPSGLIQLAVMVALDQDLVFRKPFLIHTSGAPGGALKKESNAPLINLLLHGLSRARQAVSGATVKLIVCYAIMASLSHVVAKRVETALEKPLYPYSKIFQRATIMCRWIFRVPGFPRDPSNFTNVR
ncbi:MAG: hypothetical protein JXQ83_04055, partial [Candidatus Glassbacteria bacterium]|nr:hypothetical protein [Candidatus Glassbacteria bacterium]